MLKGKERSYLKQLAHPLKPKLLIGKAGLSENTIKEINAILDKDEILKVKILNNNLDDKDQMIEKILEETGAEFVSSIGNRFTIYRENPEDKKIYF